MCPPNYETISNAVKDVEYYNLVEKAPRVQPEGNIVEMEILRYSQDDSWIGY